MKRALIATTVLLAAALAYLVLQRLAAAPAPAPAVPLAAEAAPHVVAPLPEPAKAPAPAHAEAGQRAEPSPAAAAPVPEPAATPPAGPRPPALPAARDEPKPRRGAEPVPPGAATGAVFADRPAQAGEGGGSKVPRIPVLRKPAAGVALPSHVPLPPHPAAPRPAAPRATATALPAAPVATAPPRVAAPAAPLPRLVGAISGLLRDAAGGSLNGVPVVAVSAGGDDAFETITDDEGFYLLAGMRAGRYLVFGGLGSVRAPRLPARAVEVQDGRVARADLRESGGGATVRARPLRADGRPLPGQVLLVAGVLPSPATFTALLGSDAIFLPEAGTRDLLRHVPAGVYSVVVLQGPDAPPRVGEQPVAVRGDGEQVLEVRFASEVASAPRR
jgi:hypothetical protein